MGRMSWWMGGSVAFRRGERREEVRIGGIAVMVMGNAVCRSYIGDTDT